MALVAGLVLIAFILVDAFETVVLPRRVTRVLRLTRVYFASLWALWSVAARWFRRPSRREHYLGLFGSFAFVLLLATWAAGLVVGFALVHWGLGAPLHAAGPSTFGTYLYLSGTTFFTLGLGDVSPASAAGRTVTVVESGLGFVFLAMVIGYLPVFYQAFSRRETHIVMLDEWAGTPPSGAELLRRLARWREPGAIEEFLAAWERWGADVLETHISYPILVGFRSQHVNQSWLAALVTVLDACAMVLALIEGVPQRQAWLTFAMARHTLVDLAQVLWTPPDPGGPDRLPPEDLTRLRERLAEAGVAVRQDPGAAHALADLRALYEPFARSLSARLLLPLPPWLPADGVRDNWQKTAWD